MSFAIPPIGATALTDTSSLPTPGAGLADAGQFDRITDLLENQATPGSAGPSMVGQVVDDLQATQSASRELTIGALTGEVDDLHQATLAATEAQLQLEMVSNIRNRAIEGINEILRTQV